jgi:Na+/melibiose symporter-like transporter
MTIWAALCLVLFLITFFTTRERIKPVSTGKTSPRQDFADLVKSSPWVVMVLMTLVHFGILSFRGGALYNYYHHYADKGAMYDFLDSLGLVSAPGAGRGGLLDAIGYRVHGTRADLAASNVADVFNSIINMVGTGVTTLVILLSPALARRFGKKAVSVGGFALTAAYSLAFYLLGPTNVVGMLALTVLIAICYAPTIPLVWAIYADVADYSEWQTGRRFTGIVFATIGLALKSGLALGSATFLWIMSGLFGYETHQPSTASAVAGYRACAGIVVGFLFGVCTVLLAAYKLDKKSTLEMADELEARRRAHTDVRSL